MIKERLLAVTVAVVFTACGGGTKVPEPSAPKSHQAGLIESQSATEVLVRATGIGATMGQALSDSRMTSLWFVLLGGNNPMLQTPKEKNLFEMYSEEFYKNASKYIAYQSGPKSKKVVAGQLHVAQLLRINSGMLREDLVAKGVLTSVDAMSDALGTISVAVIPKDKELWNDTHYLAAVDVVSEYLQDRNFEVTVLKANKKTNKIINKAAALSGNIDPMYALAMQTGADIYIRVNLDKSSRKVAGSEVRKASVSMAAFYTATAKQVGASTGYSPERVVSSYTSITQEATNDATEKVLGQIQKSWKREMKKGKYFKVVITTSEGLGKEVDRPMYRALKRTCKRVKRNGASSSMFDYTLQCLDVEDSMALLDKIEGNYDGSGSVFREMDAGSLLVLKVANSQDDEIIIE